MGSLLKWTVRIRGCGKGVKRRAGDKWAKSLAEFVDRDQVRQTLKFPFLVVDERV